MIPFFAVKLPANSLAFFSFLLQIVSFEMIPCEFLYSEMEQPLSEIPVNERAERYESIGFDGVWIVINLGSFFLLLCLFPFRFLKLAILRLLERKWPQLKKHRKSARHELLWEWPIATIKESFIVIAMSCLINISFIKWESTEDNFAARLNLVIAYILCAFTILYPAI